MILAIIALIAVPLIMNVIEKARKGAFQDTAYGILASAEYRYTQHLLKETSYSGETFEFPNDTVLEFKGAKPLGGTVMIKNDGTVTSANTNSPWYNYGKKNWANAVLVKDTHRSEYQIPGTVIPEAEILAYYVWIPRYRYQLFNAENGVVEPQTITVQFEDRNTSKSNGSKNGEWLTHPAFTFDSKELNGIWVGKFELTGSYSSACTSESCTTANLTIKPNQTSVANQNIGSFFYGIRSMQRSGNIYGLSNDANSHLIKNLEWGAVAYLSHSEYGINGKVRINNTRVITGCGASVDNGVNTTACEIAYGKTNSYPQSTTGNISGIFDMSGGYGEYVMGAMYKEGNTNIVMLNYSDGTSVGFSTAVIDSSAMRPYLDKYHYGERNDHSRGKLGDATRETMIDLSRNDVGGWYSGSADCIMDTFPWIKRGGKTLFSYNISSSTGGSNDGTRAILTVS